MYQDIKELYGRKLRAADGHIGHVKDFYFELPTWAVRYVVVDTGTWLAGHQVLLAPHAFGGRPFGRFQPGDKALAVGLTRRQIEAAPRIEAQRPVSREYEEQYYHHFGWPVYWDGGGLWGAAEFPVSPERPMVPPFTGDAPGGQASIPHLFRTRGLVGYRTMATDGPVGTVRSFTVEIWSWTIREVVVETGHWYSGKPILFLPEHIRRISHEDACVFVTLSTEEIQRTLKNEVAQPAPAFAGHGAPSTQNQLQPNNPTPCP